MKKLPIGIQNISEIIEEDYLYIDKTQRIYELITSGKIYFLSRPRRFGKSLLVSTIQAIFENKRSLFQDLWIGSSDYSWQEYPVIRIDFSKISSKSPELLEEGLKDSLLDVAKKYSVCVSANKDLKRLFVELIEQLGQNCKVVLLIDEYDKAIIDNINNLEVAQANRSILKAFYGVIKPMDEYLKFVFLTGISKFSQVSIFSDLNSLEDISMLDQYGDLLGVTQKELESVFKPWIEAFAARRNCTRDEFLEQVRSWYNGFQFGRGSQRVYNPFSLLHLFKHQEFKNYWFSSATPSFLIDLIKTQKYDVQEVEKDRVTELAFASYDIEQLDILPILVQTGYLTIGSYDSRRMLYSLVYPNLEVRQSFIAYLLELFSKIGRHEAGAYVWDCIDALEINNLDDFFKTLKVFFANIPHTIHLPYEKYYQSIFHCVFTLLGLNIQSEVCTNEGRIDAVIQTQTHVYVLEFKLNGTAEQALDQIKSKKYYEKYQSLDKQIVLVGAAFDQEKRTLEAYLSENL